MFHWLITFSLSKALVWEISSLKSNPLSPFFLISSRKAFNYGTNSKEIKGTKKDTSGTNHFIGQSSLVCRWQPLFGQATLRSCHVIKRYYLIMAKSQVRLFIIPNLLFHFLLILLLPFRLSSWMCWAWKNVIHMKFILAFLLWRVFWKRKFSDQSKKRFGINFLHGKNNCSLKVGKKYF